MGLRRLVWAGWALTLVAGCGLGQQPSPTSSASTDGSATATTTQLLIWADDLWQEPLSDAARSYEAARGVQVTVRAVSTAEIGSTLPAKAAQGQGPDLFVGPSEWVGELVGKGLVAAVDFAGKNVGFSRQSLDAFRLGARVYGVPICAENLALLRNRTLAPRTPASIEDMAASGKRIVAKLKAAPHASATPTTATSATPTTATSATPSQPTPATSNIEPIAVALPIGTAGDPEAWYPFFSAYGGYIYGQTDSGAVDPLDLGVGLAGSVLAGKALQKLVDLGAVSPQLDRATAAAAFNTGKTPYLIGDLDNVVTAKNAGIDVAVEPVPGAKYDNLSRSQSLVTYQGVMLSQFSHDRQVALDFLTDAVMTTSFMDAAFAVHPRQPAWLSSAAKVATDPVVAAFAAYAADSIPTPNVAGMPVVWRELGSAQVAITIGKPPRTALKAARSAITREAGANP